MLQRNSWAYQPAADKIYNFNLVLFLAGLFWLCIE